MTAWAFFQAFEGLGGGRNDTGSMTAGLDCGPVILYQMGRFGAPRPHRLVA
jgi:hypothetical protein